MYKLIVKTKDRTDAHTCVLRGFGSCLPAQGSSRTSACPMAPAPASWLRAAPKLTRVPWAGSPDRELLK
jgi:hypothetical protein